ncbi:hypothetical protein GCM10028789_14010 [Sinomonas halotolerans]
MRAAAMGTDYTIVANSIKVGLVLLNSENRDQHTNRSIETPAVGQLVLAQDTVEHRELFTHGESALLFSSLEGAIRLAQQMREDPWTAARIAAAGTEKIRYGAHTYRDRAVQLADALGVS